ncbi:NADH-cytochrome B5 reductase, putative [Cordyceps militaris CM01]|uniref:NADH-cytochrome b5 reductase n=1 Tax=Cordyceps militaris (strain CM01) TaxID=983644 RepID=G3J750_CORMM|nr:NADH-cytochrome B5 reductase, putative [Cordyceps militaris CM01]EGX95423.1 NADH-cytochrome B5 reductase, putative [Cordyceps militaris CM01]
MLSSTITRSRPTATMAKLAGGMLVAGLATKYTIGVAHAESPAAPPRSQVFGRGPALVSLVLEDAEMVNHNTRRLRFRFQDKEAASGLPLTSALLTYSWPKDSWLPVIRPYTPITTADETGHLDLLVKQYPNGKSSTHLHSLKPGHTLFFVAPLSGHQWQPNSYKHVTLIAGGAGITPIYQLAQGILNNPDDKTAVTVVFGVNSDRDVLFKKEFDEYEQRFPGRFRAVYTVSSPVPGSPHRKGHVNEALLKEVTPAPGPGNMVFVSGPPPMETALVGSRREPGILEKYGYRKEQVYKF